MNKYKVEEMLPQAMNIIEKNKKVNKSTRSMLSAFGATIVMSGLLPAVASFSKKDDNKCIVTELIKEMTFQGDTSLFDYVMKNNNDEIKEKIINCVIALKLALDAYH